MALEHWLQLALTDGIGPVLQMRLIEASGGDVAAACNSNAATLRNIDGIGSGKSSKIAESLKRAADQVQAELTKARDACVDLICIEEIWTDTLCEDDLFFASLEQAPLCLGGSAVCYQFDGRHDIFNIFCEIAFIY